MAKTENKIALITGGARRIGAEICRELHRHGCCILIHCHASRQEAERLAQELNAARDNSCDVIAADLSKADQLNGITQRATERWGKLDYLVNNASAFFPTEISRITDDQWNELFSVNAKSPLFLTQAMLTPLRQSQGCVINILDVHAERPMRKHIVYSASKSALAAITRSLARELAPDIRVNGVAPGAILWPESDDNDARKQSILKRIPLGRCGEARDIARTVRFLAMEAPYITGQIINVDGGRSLNI